jgi:hypothetical protein
MCFENVAIVTRWKDLANIFPHGVLLDRGKDYPPVAIKG